MTPLSRISFRAVLLCAPLALLHPPAEASDDRRDCLAAITSIVPGNAYDLVAETGREITGSTPDKSATGDQALKADLVRFNSLQLCARLTNAAPKAYICKITRKVAATSQPAQDTDPPFIVPDSASHFAPSISPNGRFLAFYAYRTSGTPDLALLDLETSEIAYLTNTPDNWEIEPRWDQHGNELIFGSGEGMPQMRPSAIRVANGQAAGPGSMPDTLSVGMGSVSRLTDDGSLVFVQRYGYPIQRRLAILEASGEVRPILADFPIGTVSSPIVIAAQNAILFRISSDLGSDLYILSLENNQVHRLTFNEQEEGYVGVSPNGKWITWSYEAEDGSRSIYGSEVHTDAPNWLSPRRLTDGPNGQVQFFSSVSSDGQWLYYDTTVDGRFVIFRQNLSISHLPPEQLTTAQSD